MVLDSDKELYRITDSNSLNADKPTGGFWAGISEAISGAAKTLIPVATSVLAAKYTAQTAAANAKIAASNEAGAALPVNTAGGAVATPFNWKSPAVLIAAGVAALLALVLIFRRK